MQRVVNQASEGTRRKELPPSFSDWTVREVDRLLAARATARTAEERATVELKIAILCDAAQRFGRSLAESAEL